MHSVSVIIPVFNEAATVETVLARVRSAAVTAEIVVVDDGSRDGTGEKLERLRAVPGGGPLNIVRHPSNRGKGAAVRTGIAVASAEIVLVQDADLEYDPRDYATLLAPFDDPAVMAVYGSRNMRPNGRSSFAFYWGGRLLSWVTNVLYGSRLTDEATGYKVVRTALLRELDLKADGFEFCAELTAKLLRRGVQIHEVPISYRPRSRSEGKKIRARDGWVAILTLFANRWGP